MFAVAHLTFREAIRRKALLGAVALTLAFVCLYAWGTSVAMRELNESMPRGLLRAAEQTGLDARRLAVGEFLLAGLFAVSNIGGLLAIFLAAGAISQEVDQGTLHSIVSKPLARWEVVLGKWLGGSAMLCLYVLVTSAVTSGVMYLQSGYLPSRLAPGLLLLCLKVILLFSVTLLGSAFLPAITTGIVMLIVYVVTNVAGMVEQIGTAFGIESMVRVGVIASLVLPSDALWKMGASLMQPEMPGMASQLRQLVGPFSVANPPSAWMGVYSLLYLGASLLLTSWVFGRKDL